MLFGIVVVGSYEGRIFGDADARRGHKVDLNFPGVPKPERGIDIEELEVLA